MLRVLAALLAFSSFGCVKPTGRLERNRFQHERYPWAMFYVEGGDASMPLGPPWRVDNLATDSVGTYPKKGPEYVIDRAYDLDRDGEVDETRSEAFYDLLLVHTQKDARLWLRTVPLAAEDRDTDLSALATRYLEAARAQGTAEPSFGVETVSAKKSVELRPLLQRPCDVSKRDAMRLDFELSLASKTHKSEDFQRAAVVLIRSGYSESVSARGKHARYPVLLVLGMSSAPGEFAALEADFDHVLKKTVLGDVGKGLSMNGQSSCGADGAAPSQSHTETSGGEAPPDIDPETGLQKMPP